MENVNGDNELVIFDLDGTLAKIDHRRHFVEGKGSNATDDDWRNFFAACVDDEPNWPVIKVLRAMHERGYEILILSGRSDEVKSATLAWLEKYEIPYHRLLMRKAHDYTPDQKLKAAWLSTLDRSRILCVFDDRDKVVDMWRRKGVSCFQVAPGGF